MTDILSHLAWREPYFLWLALYPWVHWAVRALLDRRGGAYADAQLVPWARAHARGRLAPRRIWRHTAFAIAWLLFALAAAGPRVALTDYGKNRENDTQLMVVVDLSKSMTARDIAPSRLERARVELDDLLAREERLRIGLVVYAARPHLMAPPTEDRQVLRRDLQLLRYGLLPTEGSNLQDAIEFASRQFVPGRSARAVLLLTDGETPDNGAAANARLYDSVTGLAQQGIRLYALGIGTSEGAPLQGPDGGWLQYRGRAVVSTLHQDRLRRIAQLGNGRYAPVSDTDADWRTLYDGGIRYLHVGEPGRHGEQSIEWREYFGWCLVPGILLLLVAGTEPRRVSPVLALLPWLAVAAAVTMLHPLAAQAAPSNWQQRAYQAYRNQSWDEAKQNYARVAGYTGRMGEGSSAYHLGRYAEAAGLFTQAILDADSDHQRARAIFNLANCRYRLADFAAALALYRESLRYQPDNRAARTNLGFAQAMAKRHRHIGRKGGGGRQGRGPRSVRPAPGTDLSNGYVAFEKGEKPRSPATSSPPSTPLPGSDLVEQGIYHSRLAVRKATEYKDPLWRYAPTTPERIALQAKSLKVHEQTLWKRIFEAEEGFPAPLETPEPLPDTPPW